jgi:hypothetical protein
MYSNKGKREQQQQYQIFIANNYYNNSSSNNTDIITTVIEEEPLLVVQDFTSVFPYLSYQQQEQDKLTFIEVHTILDGDQKEILLQDRFKPSATKGQILDAWFYSKNEQMWKSMEWCETTGNPTVGNNIVEKTRFSYTYIFKIIPLQQQFLVEKKHQTTDADAKEEDIKTLIFSSVNSLKLYLQDQFENMDMNILSINNVINKQYINVE